MTKSELTPEECEALFREASKQTLSGQLETLGRAWRSFIDAVLEPIRWRRRRERE